jgi:hypothetical protein
MHAITVFGLVFAAWKWGEWKNIKNMLPTLWYVASMNLLYHLIVGDYWLWKYSSSWLSLKTINIIQTFIVLPAVTFLFISHLPNQLKSRLFYTAAWMVGSCLWSVLFWVTGRLSFYNGYECWMDFPFYGIMYGFITLHPKHPLLTYFVSIIVVTFYVFIFDVPW